MSSICLRDCCLRRVVSSDKFCSPVNPLGWCLCFSSSSEWRVLLVLSSVEHGQVPTVSSSVGCCRTLTRSSMRFGCSMEACGRISHIFFVLLALFAWNLDIISRALCIWQAPAPVVATVHGDFWMNFFFPREKWTPTTWQFWQSPLTACVSLR